MKVAALLALVAICHAAEQTLVPTSAPATDAVDTVTLVEDPLMDTVAAGGKAAGTLPPTVVINKKNETRFLKHSHRASLNFACPISGITVTQEGATSEGFVDPIDQNELEDHLGEVGSVQWTHTLQQYFAGTDPRGQERQLGALGCDLGEFLIVLAAIESEENLSFTAEETRKHLATYLTVMSKDKFYFSTDAAAIEVFKAQCGCPNLNIADPPDAKKDLLLNATLLPESMADEFFNKLIADPTAMGVRADLVQNVVAAFFTIMWDKSSALHRRIKFVLLKGDFDPKAFILVKTPGYCNAQLLAPMISPELCGKQMSIYHGDASVLLRTEIASILLLKTPEAKNNVVRKTNDLVSAMIKVVTETHDEPVYTVAFDGADAA